MNTAASGAAMHTQEKPKISGINSLGPTIKSHKKGNIALKTFSRLEPNIQWVESQSYSQEDHFRHDRALDEFVIWEGNH